MTEHPADNLQRVAAHLPTFRDPLGPAFRRMEELNASLTRMAEVHNGLGHLAGIEKSIARMAGIEKSIGQMAGMQNVIAQTARLADYAPRIQDFVLRDPLADFHQEMAKLWEERARAAAEAREAHSAAGCVRRLEAEIRLFESQLDAAQDVGIRLVNFGSEITFHVTDIGSVEPDLIIFSGKTQAGAPVRLLQHRNQIDFLLTTLERSDPDQPKRPVGFHHQ